MNAQLSARLRAGAAAEGMLDVTDPHAGDDDDWEVDEVVAAPAIALDSSFLRFWEALLLGVLFSALSWWLLAAAIVVLHNAVTRA